MKTSQTRDHFVMKTHDQCLHECMCMSCLHECMCCKRDFVIWLCHTLVVEKKRKWSGISNFLISNLMFKSSSIFFTNTEKTATEISFVLSTIPENYMKNSQRISSSWRFTQINAEQIKRLTDYLWSFILIKIQIAFTNTWTWWDNNLQI